MPPDDQAEFQGRINILVLGIDTGVNGGSKSLSPEENVQTIMVVSVDPEPKRWVFSQFQEIPGLSFPKTS